MRGKIRESDGKVEHDRRKAIVKNDVQTRKRLLKVKDNPEKINKGS